MVLGRRNLLKLTAATLLGGAGAAAGVWLARPSSIPVTGHKPAVLTIGLYSWNEMTFMPSRIQWLGLSYARLGGVLSDDVMTLCAANGIEVLFTETQAQARTSFSSDQDFINAYLANIDTTLTRYGPRGTFWSENPALSYRPIGQLEVCNEPNFGYGFSGTTAEIAALYAKVLIAAYNHIKATWPDVMVVGFASGATSSAAPGFLAQAFDAVRAAGQADCFDVVSVHFYSLNTPPEQPITEEWGTWVAGKSLGMVRDLLAKLEITKPLWITEGGYQISHADGGAFTPTELDLAGNPVTVTPIDQAAYTIRMNMVAVRHGVPRVYHMSALDTDNYNSGWFSSAADHDPRPIAVAMRHLMRLTSGADELAIVLDGNDELPGRPYVYRFSTPRGEVTVAWSQTPTVVTVPIDAGVETVVTDMLGGRIGQVTDSSYRALLSAIPIFLYPLSEQTTAGSG